MRSRRCPAGASYAPAPLSPEAVLRVIADHLEGHTQYSVADAIVWDIRLPRVLLAAVVEATLTTAGTVVQVLVRNALADPFLLGVSSGAARRVAVVAQEFTLEFDFTLAEMVMIGRTPHKRAFDRDDEADRTIAAQAIAQVADHLILDEPTSHLDIRYQVEILELVSAPWS